MRYWVDVPGVADWIIVDATSAVVMESGVLVLMDQLNNVVAAFNNWNHTLDDPTSNLEDEDE